jgi:hypothetical protein
MRHVCADAFPAARDFLGVEQPAKAYGAVALETLDLLRPDDRRQSFGWITALLRLMVHRMLLRSVAGLLGWMTLWDLE